MINLWTPLLNTIWLAVGTCVVSIVFGGLFAFLVTRTDMAWRKYLSAIFIFPYIMPQWTLAVVWQNLFNSNAVTGTSNGLLAATAGMSLIDWEAEWAESGTALAAGMLVAAVLAVAVLLVMKKNAERNVAC